MAVLKRIYIKENIIMAVLRKANSHKVDTCRLMKINHEKFFSSCQVAHEVLRKRNVMHINNSFYTKESNIK